MSLELRIAGATVMIADEFPELGIVSPKTLGGTYGALVLATDDVERAWQRALEAGAEVFHPLQDTFWGDRSGQVVDPSGHRWGFAQHVRDVPPDEVARAAAAAFAHYPKAVARRSTLTACAPLGRCRFRSRCTPWCARCRPAA
jgi:PhnB protein